MSLAQAFNSAIPDPSIVSAIARSIALEIRRRCHVEELWLFGSAATGSFRAGSDFDFLLVFSSRAAAKEARHLLRKAGKLHPEIPVDLIFVTQDEFVARRDLGGVCHSAYHEGLAL